MRSLELSCGDRVEQELLALNDVVAAKVVPLKRNDTDLLMAYVNVRHGAPLTNSQVRAHFSRLSDELKALNIWPVIVGDALPDTPHFGETAVGASASAAALPMTELERVLCLVWATTLNRPVPIRDNILDLGAHSLHAIRAVSRLESIFPIEVPLHVIFDSPTVAGMAEALLTRTATDFDLEHLAAALLGVRAAGPCSPSRADRGASELRSHAERR